jgi:type I restriction enzyme, R subunit
VTKVTKERAFEDAIEDHLLGHGYEQGSPSDYDTAVGLDTAQLFAFIGATQNEAWERLVQLHGDRDTAQKRFTERLAKQIDAKGTIDVLRHGVEDLGVRIDLAYFRPASGLNPELEQLYNANRLSVTRQLRYSGDSKALDLVLFCNGLPVATAELKNPLTGQNVEHAKAQYREDRDHRNLLFASRAVVHFAVDPTVVEMTTRLDGRRTAFLPFDRGSHPQERGCGKGNPPNPDGYATAYLWEQVWQRDAWLDILARFLHVEQQKPGAKAKPYRTGDMIFPRYHQWDAVRRLESHARENGAGQHYLVEHSAGSGKSNTIAWLAHRLSSLHDASDTKIFDKVVVVTDRVILDRQLQDTIYQFEHAHGVVAKIEESSKQLAEALRSAEAKIIVTTLWKFPYVLDEIAKLPERRYAILIDEAHSSQSGEAAAEMKRVLGRGEEEEFPESDTQDYVDVLAERAAAGRGKQENLSIFAFTATPKAKTLEVFGSRVEGDAERRFGPFHLYSMRQAIDEGFIVDVLLNYTTYAAYYRVANSAERDPEVERSRAAAAIARFAQLHPEMVGQKAEIVVEHVRNVTMEKIGGRAKAMVVCRSRLAAVRWRLAIDRYLRDNGIGDIKALVAFSGTVTDPDSGLEFTEPRMNGFPERQTAEKFNTDEFRILVVAEKFQTGFDQPLLHTMFVDRKLAGVHAVQTLSRLNRIHPAKEDTFVLDFVNTTDEIEDAYRPYFDVTRATETDPNMLFDARDELDRFGVLRTNEIDAFARAYFAAAPDDKAAHARLYVHLDPARGRFDDLEPEDQEAFRKALKRFVQLYAFIAQIMPLHDTQMEKRYAYCRYLARRLPKRDVGVLDLGELELTHLRIRESGKHRITLDDEEPDDLSSFTGDGTGQDTLPGMEALSVVIGRINEAFGLNLDEGDLLHIESVTVGMVDDRDVQLVASANTQEGFEVGFEKRMVEAFVSRMDGDEKLTIKLLDDPEFKEQVRRSMLPIVYERARVAGQKDCPIGELLVRDEDQFLEFKSTLRWDLHKNEKSRIIESAVIKTLAGFLNSRHGGTLLIGVDDAGGVVGLEPDYASLRRETRSDGDVFQQNLMNVLENAVGVAAAANVSTEILTVDGQDLCRVHVTPSGHPVKAEVTAADSKGQFTRRQGFFVRLNNGTREVTDEAEIQRYVAQRWGRSS